MSTLAPAFRAVREAQPVRLVGRVAALRGLTVLVSDLPMPVGSLVRIDTGPGGGSGGRPTRGDDGYGAESDCHGEVVGFNGSQTIVMMLGSAAGLRVGSAVIGEQTAQRARVGPGLLGRCIDGLGRPIDGLGPLIDVRPRPLDPGPIGPLTRRRIAEALPTGVRAIDLMTTLGRGQRIGIFAGPGVGKSTLLSTIAKNARSDVNVVALIGERGREVKDFIHHALGPEGLARSVVVAATSDESPLLRLRAAMVACAAAEQFRDMGLDVLLMVDSITRYAHAQRQVGLSVGEPPATKGYPPSVFSGLARLLERAGSLEGDGPGGKGGSITGLYTILVEGDDTTEPVSDAARGILDGHIMLSRALAQKAHYPAIDVLDSVSRVADEVCDPAHRAARREVMRLLANYREVEDLVQIGAYAKGSSADADRAIAFQPRLMSLLRQEMGDREPFEQARARMVSLALEAGNSGPIGTAGAGGQVNSARGGGARR
jgi:FliI/YscN family ATPase